MYRLAPLLFGVLICLNCIQSEKQTHSEISDTPEDGLFELKKVDNEYENYPKPVLDGSSISGGADDTVGYKIRNENSILKLLDYGIGFTTTSIINQCGFLYSENANFFGTYDMFDAKQKFNNPYLGHLICPIYTDPGNWRYDDYPRDFVYFSTRNKEIIFQNGSFVGMDISIVNDEFTYLNDAYLFKIDEQECIMGLRIEGNRIAEVFVIKFSKLRMHGLENNSLVEAFEDISSFCQ